MKKVRCVIIVSIVWFGFITPFSLAQFEVSGLKTEYRHTPLGIDVEHPRFSWQMTVPNGKRGAVQSAYRLNVLDESGEVVWDSGQISSAISHWDYLRWTRSAAYNQIRLGV